MKNGKRKSFDDYLRSQRARRGLDLGQLSASSRIPLDRLVSLESGSSMPDQRELRRLASALQLPFETMCAKAGYLHGPLLQER